MTKASRNWNNGTHRVTRKTREELRELREENQRLRTKIEYLETDLRAERAANQALMRRRSYGTVQ